MLSKEEIKKWLLENCVDKSGTLYLGQLDFSDFDGDIYINDLIVKQNLYQNRQQVKGNLYQENQSVGKDLCQCYQEVKGNLFQNGQEVEENIFQDNIYCSTTTLDEPECPSLTLDYEAETDRLAKENQELKEKLDGYETLLLYIAKGLKETKEKNLFSGIKGLV